MPPGLLNTMQHRIYLIKKGESNGNHCYRHLDINYIAVLRGAMTDINALIKEDLVRRDLEDLNHYRALLISVMSARPSMASKDEKTIYEEMVQSIKTEPMAFIIFMTKLKTDGVLDD